MVDLHAGSSRLMMAESLHTFSAPSITWVRERVWDRFARFLKIEIAAPEYALDEQLLTASDMYSLGCLIFAVHCKGAPPYKTHANLSSLRENARKPLIGIERLDKDLQGSYVLWLLTSPSLTVNLSAPAIPRQSPSYITSNSVNITFTFVLLFSTCLNTQLLG